MSFRVGIFVKPSVQQVLEIGLNRVFYSERTDVYYVGESGKDFCAVGAIAGRNPEPITEETFTFAELGAIQELFFAIPRAERDALVQSVLDELGCYPQRLRTLRVGVVARYNDLLDKEGVWEWVRHAIYRLKYG